jgi:ferrous iron transport protein B
MYAEPNFRELNRMMTEMGAAENQHFRDQVVADIYSQSEQITKAAVKTVKNSQIAFEDRLDNVLTSRIFGYPIMMLILGTALWVTIAGANVPSSLLGSFFAWSEQQLSAALLWINTPMWLHDCLP